MAIVKLEALAALAAAIATAVPALTGKITIHQEVPAKIETFPNLAIILPGRLPFEPHQRLLQQSLAGNVSVYNVGAHSGPMQMRITTTTKLERAALEQSLINFALSRQGAPGVIVVPVTDADAVSWVAAFEYEDSMWMDQRAIEREYEAVLTFTAIIPALVAFSPEYTIDHLILGLTGDFATTFTPSTAIPPAVELVEINQDGSISPVT